MAAGVKSAAHEASRIVRAIDKAQQNHSWLAMVVATWKKFGDDQAGNLAALVAYFAFASLFPLLLVAYTILDLVAKGSPSVAKQLESALKGYPVIGNLGGHTIHGAGLALAAGLVLTLYASLGVANAIQNAMNTAWAVPKFQRPGFPKNKLRSLGLIAVIGPGETITIALSTLAGGAGHLVGGAGGTTAAIAVSLLLNFGLFWLAFRIATPKQVSGRELLLGAILAAIAWQILQLVFSSGLVLLHSRSAYGTFATVLAIMAWFYLQAQITLYVVELDVVRSRRLWPRSLVPPPLTEADLAAYRIYAQQTQLRPELDISVTEAPVPAPRPASDEAQRQAPDAAQRPAPDTTQRPAPDAAQRSASDATQQPATDAAQQTASEVARRPASDAAQPRPTDRPGP
jgi:YihY family inner membrane protein